MTNQDPAPPDKSASSWVTALVVGLIVIAILAVASALLFMREAGAGLRPVITETLLKDHDTGLILKKRVERFKDRSELITLTIGGPRSVEEPFAFYQRETRAEFHWDHGKLDACIEGEGFTDKGGYWLDHIDLPDGGQIEIVKTCSGPRMIDSAAATPVEIRPASR